MPNDEMKRAVGKPEAKKKRTFTPVGNFATAKKKAKGSRQAEKYNEVLKGVKGDATKIPGFTFGKNTK